MKMQALKLFAVFLIMQAAVSTCFAQKSYGISDNTVKRIEAKYKNIYSITSYFYQKETIPGYSQNMAFKGHFYYKRNNHSGGASGMAWVYEYPFHKRQVLKNGRLYIVNNQIKKVTVINVGKERGGYPPNVIKVIGSLTKYFTVENISENSAKGQIILKLKPVVIQRAKIIYAGFDRNSLKINSLKIITHQNQTITLKYKNVKFNRHINGAIFNINFPSNYKIIKEN
jgi:outer membrane lipoprotein-sorting protein